MIKGIIFDWRGTLYDPKKEQLYPSSAAVLEHVKPHYTLGLVTLIHLPTRVAGRWLEIDRTGVLPYFNGLMIDYKKTPWHYQQCMQEMGTTANETAIVDNHLIRGIKIGNQLGCKTYWVQQGEFAHEVPSPERGQPDVVIDTVEDLLKLL